MQGRYWDHRQCGWVDAHGNVAHDALATPWSGSAIDARLPRADGFPPQAAAASPEADDTAAALPVPAPREAVRPPTTTVG